MKFHVVRQHLGDKMYYPNDVREANEADVKHLLISGVLSKEKMEPKVRNKAEKRSPANKAEG